MVSISLLQKYTQVETTKYSSEHSDRGCHFSAVESTPQPSHGWPNQHQEAGEILGGNSSLGSALVLAIIARGAHISPYPWMHYRLLLSHAPFLCDLTRSRPIYRLYLNLQSASSRSCRPKNYRTRQSGSVGSKCCLHTLTVQIFQVSKPSPEAVVVQEPIGCLALAMVFILVTEPLNA